MTTIASTSATTTVSTTSTSSSGSTSIDWSALIEASVVAKTARADSIDVKITKNDTKSAAYQNMQTLLSAVQTAAQALRAPSGTLNKSADVFQHRTAYLTSNGDVDASSSLAVTMTDGAQTGSYDLEIKQLAKAHKVTSGDVASSSDDLGYSGVIQLGLGSDLSAQIAVTEDMSLADIADAINATTDGSGVQASVVKIAEGQYRLVLAGNSTGLDLSASAVSGDDILSQIGVSDDNDDFANELTAAQQAIVVFDGIEIARDSNDIDDIVDGATFHLYQTTPADTSIAVDVGVNLSDVKTAVQTLVDAYNAYRDFAIGQQVTTSSGTAADDAVLFGDGTLRNVNRALGDALGFTTDGASMAALGLSYDSSNKLVLDEDALDNALLDDFDTVKSLLAFGVTSSSSSLMLLSRGNTDLASFSLDIVVDGAGALTGVSVDGDSSLFTVKGTRIVGNAGTAYEGYAFVFSGTATATVDVAMSSGIAERLYGTASGAADSNGTLAGILDALDSQSTAWQTRSDDIRAKAEEYRTALTARYARIQAAMEAAESTKSYLEAILEAQNNS